MRLINDQLKKQLPALGFNAENQAADIIIRAKFFALGSAATWLIAEYSPEDNIVFCYADLFGHGTIGGAEWGYASIEEMESVIVMGVPRIERDEWFKPRKFSDCVDAEGRITV